MRLKDLYTVPAGQKITERYLRRVLFSSICSILLCMSCLVGTTWAWFKVSVENENNIIQIGEPNVIVKVNNEVFESGSALPTGESVVTIEHGNEPDDLNKKSSLYVTLTIRDSEALEVDGQNTVCVYTALKQENEYKAEVHIQRETETILADGEGEAVRTEAENRYILSWEVSWFVPVNAIELIDGPILLTDGEATEETTEPTEETEPATETTEETEVTEPSTEPSTEPTEDSTESTEVPTESTEGTTEPTEPTVTESSTEPTEPSSEPTEPSTEATEPPTEATQPVTDPTEASTDPTEAPSEAATEPTVAAEEEVSESAPKETVIAEETPEAEVSAVSLEADGI